MTTSIYRTKKQENYVILDKGFLENPDLSLCDKGFLAYCMSKPSDWHFYINNLSKTLKCSEKKIYKIITNLIKFGYCFRYQEKEAGKFGSTHTIFFESTSQCDEFKINFPRGQNGHAVIAHAQNGVLLSNECLPSNDIKKKTNKKPASPLATELLTFFSSSLKENIPEVVEMPVAETAKAFDDLLKHYSPEEIKFVISWAHTDDFWRVYVHSPKYLKSKFASLMAANRRFVNGKKPEEKSQSNAEWAQSEISKIKLPYNVTVEYCSDYLEIGYNNHPSRNSLKYSENGFKDQFKNILRKMSLA